MAGNPVSTYRGEQGLSGQVAVGGYHPDPKLLDWIVEASHATHSDPIALLATALQESGGRLNGPAGDGGTSFGPFQFHVGGALANHPPAWASTYDAVLNRAQEFSRLGVHGGVGAAAVQGPLHKGLYASGVNSLLDVARQLLGTAAPVPHGATPSAPPGKPPASPTPSTLPPLQALAQGKGPDGVMGQLQFINTILNPRSSASDLLSLVQQDQGTSDPLGGSAVSPPKGVTTNLKPTPGAAGKVIPGAAKIIGTPYHGTHTLGNWESDNAVDIAVPIGTPIRAPYSGVIGSQIGSLGAGGRFAGLRVHLAGKGQELYFAHLSRLAVKAGQQVKAGQIIGYSGEANGVAHLHLGAKSGNPGIYA